MLKTRRSKKVAQNSVGPNTTQLSDSEGHGAYLSITPSHSLIAQLEPFHPVALLDVC